MAETKLNPQLEEILKALLGALQPAQTEVQEPDNFVLEGAVKEYRAFSDYPDVLEAKHIQAILGIGSTRAYEVLNSAKCPVITVGKSCKRVRKKEAFIQFLKDNEYGNLLE